MDVESLQRALIRDDLPTPASPETEIERVWVLFSNY